MDRISALRNVEDALAAFEAGDLAALERQVQGVLRTYATEFEGDLSAYRAVEPDRAVGTVVLAHDEREARERVADLLDEQRSRVAVRPVTEMDE
jgi:triosephosphate isomerase